MTETLRRARAYLDAPVPIAPLVSFRILLGLLLLYSTLRFWALGWIDDHFVDTQVQFKYFGFEWVRLLPPVWMYALHVGMVLGALGIVLGFFYRYAAALFFLCFSYCELIDLTYYLNHYYFVSIASLLLVLVPANGRFSLDVRRGAAKAIDQVPRWSIGIFQVQIAIVYVYAGLAKINADWLLAGLPLRIWLPAHDSMPLIGPLLALPATAYVFSWAGMLYDSFVVFFLSWPRTRALAYVSVVVFHTLTGLLFQIGVFPLVMMAATWIYFSPAFHERLLVFLEKRFRQAPPQAGAAPKPTPRWLLAALLLHLAFQLLFPWRYLLYPGHVFWTEEGYRFAWRVMLMEKAGTATFYVKDGRTGREGVVDNSEFLRPHQEKQMAMQPDMILQFAHFLAGHYAARGVAAPQVRVEAYVTLNGRPSQLLIDPQTDLTRLRDGWQHKTWILPYDPPTPGDGR